MYSGLVMYSRPVVTQGTETGSSLGDSGSSLGDIGSRPASGLLAGLVLLLIWIRGPLFPAISQLNLYRGDLPERLLATVL